MKRCFHPLRCLLLTAALMLGALPAQAEDHVPFLSVDDLPNAVNYLPPPPDHFNEQFKWDYYYYQQGKAQRKTPRGEQAKAEADHSTESLAKVFSPALNIHISPKTTPNIYALIGRVRDTASLSTKKGKKFFGRTRPYAYFNEVSLIPEAEATHNPNASYPSGHASMGWAVALVLSEIAPNAQDEILRRGYEFGNSRVIAGYHFESDVNAGRMAGSATVARLHADDEFLIYMKHAKAEYNSMLELKKDNAASAQMPTDFAPNAGAVQGESPKNPHPTKRKSSKKLDENNENRRPADGSVDLALPF